MVTNNYSDPHLAFNTANKDSPHGRTQENTIEALKLKIFHLEKELAQAQHFACHDDLTGLPNRTLLRDRLNQAINQAARGRKQVGLLLLDLNSFKLVNDTHGHAVGDALLVQVAKRLISCVRTADSVYRYGGDEFVILLPEVDGTAGPSKIMRKLCVRLARPYLVGGHRILTTASIGFAIYPCDGNTQYELIKQADREMYLAKSIYKSLKERIYIKGYKNT